MDNIYYLVKCWYDREAIDDEEWQEFCRLMLEYLMEQNIDILKGLKER